MTLRKNIKSLISNDGRTATYEVHMNGVDCVVHTEPGTKEEDEEDEDSDFGSDIYYRLYLGHRNDKISVICLQWFDEADYHEERFVKDSNGRAHTFYDEELAITKMVEWFEKDEVDPEYHDRYFDKNKLVRD